MKTLDYHSLIHKYIAPNSFAYSIYMPHVTLVTAKALEIAERLKLSLSQKRFIEEACMLHDIGIIKTNSIDIGCFGDLPYVCHIIEGRKILEAEGYPLHARVAENHIGVGGLLKTEIVENNMPLPNRDILCTTIEEKIISFADLYFSKNPKRVFLEKSQKQVKQKVKQYGKRQEKTFKDWCKLFGVEDED